MADAVAKIERMSKVKYVGEDGKEVVAIVKNVLDSSDKPKLNLEIKDAQKYPLNKREVVHKDNVPASAPNTPYWF